jgi:hypothetical protein
VEFIPVCAVTGDEINAVAASSDPVSDKTERPLERFIFPPFLRSSFLVYEIGQTLKSSGLRRLPKLWLDSCEFRNFVKPPKRKIAQARAQSTIFVVRRADQSGAMPESW